MSFGFSAGDFLAAISLVNDIVTCLKVSGGSASEYQELMLELDSLRLALSRIEHLKGSATQTPAINSIKVVALNCKFVLDSFLTKLKKYDKSLEYGKTRGWAIDSAKKVKWELAMKTDVQELRTYLMMHTSSLNMRLSTEGLAAALIAAEHNREGQSAVLTSLEQQQKDKKRRTILEWLSLSNMYDKQHDIYSRRQENTGEWLLNEKAFVDWLGKDDLHHTLWCPGNPGTGKTVMTSVVVDYIRNRYPSEDIGIAFVYCDYKDQARQTASELIATLAKQLAAKKVELPRQLVDLYEQLHKQDKRPDLRQLESLLLSLCSNFTQTFVIVDALDECDAINARRPFLSLLKALREASVKTFITSRPSPEDIKAQLCEVPQVEIVATESDIKRYVKEKTEGNHVFMKRITPDLEEQIIDTIAGRASGMFLMAVLQLEQIWAERTKKKILKALERLPLGLEETYRETLIRIKKQPGDDGPLAMNILRWISHAKRPLLVDELRHALAVELDDDEEPQRNLDFDNILDPESLLDVCNGLIIIEDESKVIRLVHFTTEEYFNKSRASLFPDAETQISKTCLTYLSLDELGTGFCTSDQELESRLLRLPFLNYAVRYWGDHLRGKPERDLEEMALNLLQNQGHLLTLAQVMSIPTYLQAGYSQNFRRYEPGVQLAARFGLLVIVSSLLEKGADVNEKDSGEWTALHRATLEGHEAIVRLLLEKGADVKAEDIRGWTALHWAAQKGHEAVVRLLLEKGADVMAEDSRGWTALYMAAQEGHEAIVRLLLEKGADVKAEDNEKWTALHRAAQKGHEAVVRLLLEKGADVKAEDSRGWTALHWATQGEREAVVRLLSPLTPNPSSTAQTSPTQNPHAHLPFF